MTVHDYLSCFQLGNEYKIPSNCNAKDLIEYAWTRFQYCLRLVFHDGNTYLKRVCPHCER